MGHVVSPAAEQDLDAIWYFIASQSRSVEVADRLVDTLTHCFYFLAQHPHLGRSREEDLHKSIRSFPVGEYVIFYRIDEADVAILRVLRGTRDLGSVL